MLIHAPNTSKCFQEEEAVSLFENDDQINEVFNQKFVRTIAAIRRVEIKPKVIEALKILLLNV